MADKEILVLVGLPGSGKSTYIKEVERAYAFQCDYSGQITKPFHTVISTDSVIEEIAAELGSTYNQTFRALIRFAERYEKMRFREALAHGFNIIYDQTNVTAKKRKAILSSVPSQYRKIAVVFNPPFDILKERLEKRAQDTGKVISLNMVEDMQKRFEYPSLEEGFNEIRVDSHANEQNNERNTRDNPRPASTDSGAES